MLETFLKNGKYEKLASSIGVLSRIFFLAPATNSTSTLAPLVALKDRKIKRWISKQYSKKGDSCKIKTHFQPEEARKHPTLWLLAVQSTLRMSEQNLGSGVNGSFLEV